MKNTSTISRNTFLRSLAGMCDILYCYSENLGFSSYGAALEMHETWLLEYIGSYGV